MCIATTYHKAIGYLCLRDMKTEMLAINWRSNGLQRIKNFMTLVKRTKQATIKFLRSKLNKQQQNEHRRI